MKPFKKLSAYDNVPCEYLSSTSGAGWYLTKEQQDAMERMLEGMSETLIPEIDVAALKDENAKLRQQLADVTESMGRMEERCAKLRELVLDMWRFTGTACKKYPRLFDPAAQGGQTVQLNMIDVFAQRMRELGVMDA